MLLQEQLIEQRKCIDQLIQSNFNNKNKQEPNLKIEMPKFKLDEECPAEFMKGFNNICSINGYTHDSTKINILKTYSKHVSQKDLHLSSCGTIGD